MANQTTVCGSPIHIGDTIRLSYRVIESEQVAGKTKKAKEEKQRERLQPFEGIVIAIKNRGENQSFTVRRIGVGGIGIERIFPVISPWIKKVKIISHGKVRRAKIYYIREKKGKDATKLKAGDALVETEGEKPTQSKVEETLMDADKNAKK